MFGATAVSDVELFAFFACTLIIFLNFSRIVKTTLFFAKNSFKLIVSFFITLTFYTCFKLRNYRWTELFDYLKPHFFDAFEKISHHVAQQLRSHAAGDEL